MLLLGFVYKTGVPLSTLHRPFFPPIITTQYTKYFYSLFYASQPARALPGIREIKTVHGAVSVGELRSVPACSAGRRKGKRDKAAFRSTHQSGIHTGISQLQRRVRKSRVRRCMFGANSFLCSGGSFFHS